MMQTPAAKRKRAAITIRPHKNRYQPNLCHIVAYSIEYRARKVVHARDDRQQLAIYDAEARSTRSGSTTDVTDIAGLGDVIERAASALGRKHILVNNAGGVDELGTYR